MGTVKTLLRLLLAAASVAVIAAPDASASDVTYGAPFEVGPSGGDQYNLVQATDDGRITVGRLDPRPGAISCSAAAGYARLLVHHTVTAPVASVTVDYTEAITDPYVVLSAGVKDHVGTWIGYSSVRGPIDSGTLELVLDVAPAIGETLTIELGLAVSSACPTVDAGTARFTQVTIHAGATP